mmetsp:Transcript_21085/g.53051  ORF Transcript_21085/g.53051 Transcript_21085/m.53051 type:complete len:350 (+) Transcript_21085:258-1307(+)
MVGDEHPASAAPDARQVSNLRESDECRPDLASFSLSQLLERLAAQRWSPELPFTELEHLSFPRQLLCLRDLGTRRDLNRLQELLDSPELCGPNGKALRQRWFSCFRLYAAFNSANARLDRNFLLPFMALKLGNDPTNAVERMTRWLEKREALAIDILSSEELFHLEGKSAWAVKSAYSNLRSSFSAMKDVITKHMSYSEKYLPPLMEDNFDMCETRDMLAGAMASLYGDMPPDDMVCTQQKYQYMFLSHIYLHVSGPQLKGDTGGIVGVLADSTRSILISQWIPEVRAAYFDVLYELQGAKHKQTKHKTGLLRRLWRRGKTAKSASNAAQSIEQYALVSATARRGMLHS